MKFGSVLSFQILVLLQIVSVLSIDLDISSSESICNAASLILDGMMDYYEGTRRGGTVGMFQEPYYWWQAGELFGGLLDMWYYCENDTYHDIIYEGMMHQRGDNLDYNPANQSTSMGNDDQGLWGILVMAATERNFTNPPDDQPGWLLLTQAVFNEMWSRWDDQHCGGGLRWQVFTWNSGYNYKNTVSNGCMFNIGARLARYTQNDTYVDKCETMWEWITGVGFMEYAGAESDGYSVYDGAGIESNCSEKTENQWTYNFGLYLGGCAYLYNFTEDEIWKTRAESLWSGASIFLNTTNGILFERQCQQTGTCNNDERSFKALYVRMLGLTSVMMPDLLSDIDDTIQKSALGAALSCTGGYDGHTCGMNWGYGGNDGWYGLGEQMGALEIMQANLVHDRPAPYTEERGGSSKGNSELGLDTDKVDKSQNELLISTKDKVGAGILTGVVLGLMFGGGAWMIF